VITGSIFARFLFAFGIVLGSLLLAGIAAGVSAGLVAEVSAGVSGEESRPPPGTPPNAATRQEVWQVVVAELEREGLSEQRLPRIEDLELPAALPALAGRRLHVSSACWDEGPRRTQFRLECGEPGQCLPFLVYLHDAYLHNAYLHNHVSDYVRDDQNSNARDGSCRPASEPQRAPEPSPKPSAKLVLRAGDRATAVFLSNRLRMTASVTCLERGRKGEVIRVRSQDGRVFRARISGPARLEALPQQ
jgi:Chaperone for flagella basal body P-ring formation